MLVNLTEATQSCMYASRNPAGIAPGPVDMCNEPIPSYKAFPPEISDQITQATRAKLDLLAKLDLQRLEA